jgi:adenine deaminase
MNRPHTRRRELVDVAMGRKPADRILSGGKLVNVITSEIYPADVAIKGDRIAAIGDVKRCKGPKTDVINAKGAYLVPGLVEPHLHCYHTYINVTHYAKAVLIHGTTAVADGFYGPGIISGVEAVRFMLGEFKQTPLKLIFSAPTLAYLQNRELGISPAPNSISSKELMEMLDWPETLGLEEPPFLPIIEKDKVFLDLFEKAVEKRIAITGHASGIGIPAALNAYAASGAITDHESTEVLDAVEKARVGIRILMRQGSGAFDLRELSKALTEHRLSSRAFSFSADLAAPEKLFYEGDINECIRVAVRSGVDPVTAIQMGTLNAAEVYNLQLEIGSIAPGRIADVLFVRDLRDFDISRVIANGETVVEDGKFLPVLKSPKYPDYMYGTVKLKRPVTPGDFNLHASKGKSSVKVRVIGAVDLSLYSLEKTATLKVEDGVVQPDQGRDILRISMIDRHGATGEIGNGFVNGFKLKKGAIASSVNAVCENIVVVGTNKEDMAFAANHLAKIGGGKVVVADGKIVAQIELPLFGLLSDEPLERVIKKFDKAYEEIRRLGCQFTSPFSTLEFCCACGEIGKIKIFQGGLIDAEKPEKVSVVIE